MTFTTGSAQQLRHMWGTITDASQPAKSCIELEIHDRSIMHQLLYKALVIVLDKYVMPEWSIGWHGHLQMTQDVGIRVYYHRHSQRQNLALVQAVLESKRARQLDCGMHRRQLKSSHPSTYSKRRHQCCRLDIWVRYFLRARFCYWLPLSSLSPSELRVRAFMPKVWWRRVKSTVMTCKLWSEHCILSISFVAYIVDGVISIISHSECN